MQKGFGKVDPAWTLEKSRTQRVLAAGSPGQWEPPWFIELSLAFGQIRFRRVRHYGSQILLVGLIWFSEILEAEDLRTGKIS